MLAKATVQRPEPLTDEAGVTLLEVSLMLIVTAVIVFALAPTLVAVVRNARNTAASDAMTDIQTAVLAFQDDMQVKIFTFDASNNSSRIVYLLVTDGDIPREVSDAATMATWQTAVVNSSTTRYDFLERHLVLNDLVGAAAPAYNELGNPEAPARGWRGPYLNAPLDPDPWGNRYMINSQWLDPNSTNDVVVLSAGQNEIIETVFEATSLSAGGDDLIVLLES
ncbi:MAG: type II secretion system protein GspG [Acidobacteria bacterium]|nr:type II secretion system protein GspG [Acidobacteriota bacterium]